MATYPGIIGASQAKQQRMNKIYGATTASVRPARKIPQTSKGSSNMLKRMIKGLVNWSFKDDNRESDICIAEDREARISANGMKFEVYRANGGTVIETRRYNRKNDDTIYELHVVTDTQDVGQAIGQIITMEALKS